MKLFTESEIQEVYERYFLSNRKDYLSQYNKIPKELNGKNWKWEGKDFPRVRAIIDFSNWVKKHQIGNIKKLLITDLGDPELEFLTHEELTFIPYKNGTNDLHTLNLSCKSHDFIIFNQTLEHLYNPFICLENLYNHLKVGGYLYTTVPTINIPHMVPYHFWGITPMGLCMIMKSVGFEIIEVGYWGNYNYISQLFKNHTWPDIKTLKSTANELNNECQCWILVRK